MRVSSLLGLGWLTADIQSLSLFGSPNSTQSVSASPSPIYILRTTHPATSALSRALDTLGYRGLDPAERDGPPHNTYVEVSSGAQLAEIARARPHAKFILPRDAAAGPAGHSVRAFFGEEEEEGGRAPGLLELDVLALESAVQAENWVALCKFLGLGYSVVERLGLWHFPR
ncbi:hypothetical protein AAE478_004905 [Parahypoxylon ruwenzoriense]